MGTELFAPSIVLLSLLFFYHENCEKIDIIENFNNKDFEFFTNTNLTDWHESFYLRLALCAVCMNVFIAFYEQAPKVSAKSPCTPSGVNANSFSGSRDGSLIPALRLISGFKI